MDMKKIIFPIVLITSTLFFQSCSNEKINSVPPDFATADLIAGNKTNVLQFVNNLYSFVPRGYNRLDLDPSSNDAASGSIPTVPAPGAYTSMVAAATDEAVHVTRNSASEKWATGQWSSSPLNDWDTRIKTDYTGIRRTFTFTEDIVPKLVIGPGANEILATQRDQYMGETLFIRALLNFELLKRYGGYSIVKKQLNADENMSIPRSTYSDCVQYISDLCDQAKALLPLNYNSTISTDFGRATKGAAMALKARLLLYAASPLNNTTNDVAKWQAAAAASAAIIATNIYSLYPGYDTFFTTLAGNNEIIFSRLDPLSNTYERLNGLPSISGGLGGTCPTLDLVNDYETIDGKPFDWSNPAMAANPFANRDPRFAKSILYNGATWMNSGTSAVVETFDGGKDAVGPNATRTGFYLRKFLTITARWVAPVGTANHCFPIFRYGEVLLNFAEAMNEAYGPDNPSTYGMTARQAITLIRTRAGLTGNLNVAAATDQAAMRTAIRHERRIEMAFEEQRGFDLRRWKTAEAVLNQPVSGLKIVKTGTTYTYTPQVVEQRAFATKMYLYPFPQDELSRNPSLVQNPGW